jgi:hypothetical protein
MDHEEIDRKNKTALAPSANYDTNYDFDATATLLLAAIHACAAWVSVQALEINLGNYSRGFDSKKGAWHRALSLVSFVRCSLISAREVYESSRASNRARRRRRRRRARGGRRGAGNDDDDDEDDLDDVDNEDFVETRERKHTRNEKRLWKAQTKEHDTKTALERANEALYTADAVLDSNEYDENDENVGANLRNLGSFAMRGIRNDLMTKRERVQMRKMIGAVLSVCSAGFLRVSARGVSEMRNPIQTVFVATRAINNKGAKKQRNEKKIEKEEVKSLGLEGVKITRGGRGAQSTFDNNNSSNQKTSASNDVLYRWKSNAGLFSINNNDKEDDNSRKRRTNVFTKGTRRLRFKEANADVVKKNSFFSKILRGSSKGNERYAKKIEERDEPTWIEKARERLPAVAPVLVILFGFALP